MTVPITDAVDAVLFTADDLAAAARALRATYRP
jgi:hypothetical protein